ncbi:protein phosphatase 1 regulatory subunit 35 [Notolabrus celidotus]|uniref:protein phosphatase 1 regulatory subunit 35 n=1 Tax=Notolabrus celidotus TaxID=1203425 RepID=UPI001490375F|nr:protein phosphatase 1 regulatory subunit 35 [Notolabrus celidotus]
MKSSVSLLSPPPSPHPAPLPLSTSPMVHCPELDLSISLSPAPKIGPTHLKSRPLKITQQHDHSQPKPRPRGQTKGKGDSKVRFEEPLVITVTPEPNITVKETLPQQPIRGQRRSRGRHPGSQTPRQWAESPPQDPGCLETVELNTTLALKAELQSLQGAGFNTQRAVQETLQRSERTKHLINTRATEEVNVSRSQALFTSLVSVDVREEQLISQVLQDRLHLAQPSCHSIKVEDGPSLSIFMTSDLFRQKPLPLEDGPVCCKPRLQTRPTCSTFDLFKRRTRYEAVP